MSINITNGRLLWHIAVKRVETMDAISLPIAYYGGYLIIANSTGCVVINPQGVVSGVFNYNPKLIPPLAGPFVTRALHRTPKPDRTPIPTDSDGVGVGIGFKNFFFSESESESESRLIFFRSRNRSRKKFYSRYTN